MWVCCRPDWRGQSTATPSGSRPGRSTRSLRAQTQKTQSALVEGVFALWPAMASKQSYRRRNATAVGYGATNLHVGLGLAAAVQAAEEELPSYRACRIGGGQGKPPSRYERERFCVTLSRQDGCASPLTSRLPVSFACVFGQLLKPEFDAPRPACPPSLSRSAHHSEAPHAGFHARRRNVAK